MTDKIKCPECRSQNIIDIVFGYPTARTLEEAEKGSIHLGGCEVTGNDPTRFCRDCGMEFLKKRRFNVK